METGEWKIASAVVAGSRHRRALQPTQDALCWGQVGSHYLVVAAADGAGSAQRSHLGAELAVVQAFSRCCTGLSEGKVPLPSQQGLSLVQQAVETARSTLFQEAQSRGFPPRDLACTLLVLIAHPDGAVAAQVGDGAIVIGSEQTLHCLTWPTSGEYINETVFLTSSHNPLPIQLKDYQGPVRRVAVFTDGLQALALDLRNRQPYGPFFNPLFSWLQAQTDPRIRNQELDAWLRSDRVAQRTDDDVSLFLALWSEADRAASSKPPAK